MNDNFTRTHPSLLTRLKNWDDSQTWTEFFNTYGKLIYRFAYRAGLTDAEAQDVVQETIVIVARKIPGFKYDPALGSFRGWLLVIARRRVLKQLQKRLAGSPARIPRSWGSAGIPNQSNDDTKRTATVERLPDPRATDLEAAWASEWEKNLWEMAIGRVKTQVKPKQFQTFDLYVLKEWPPKEVARALGVSQTNVYVTKHRVGSLLKKEMKRLAQQPL
jgi:RNA polymerase sigma-70 factor (ECF subfamily)